MTPKRYRFHGEQVLEQIDEAPEDVKEEFLALLTGLQDHPHPLPGEALLGVMPLKEKRGGMFTAPFDDGLLVYQVMADYPIIKLIQVVTWLD